jgi:hypothetical protein
MIIDNELASKISKLLKNFLEIHKTEETERISKCVIEFNNLYSVFDIFNKNISWYATKDGAPYYYFINLRWVIALTYLCHEHSMKYDKFCLKQIRKYYAFCGSNFSTVIFGYFKYNREDCIRKLRYYTKKIEKIEKIFGN